MWLAVCGPGYLLVVADKREDGLSTARCQASLQRCAVQAVPTLVLLTWPGVTWPARRLCGDESLRRDRDDLFVMIVFLGFNSIKPSRLLVVID